MPGAQPRLEGRDIDAIRENLLDFAGVTARRAQCQQVERLLHDSHVMVRLTVALSGSSQRCVLNLVEGLRFLMSGTRLEPGCRECSVWVDPDSTVHYVEEWETEADIRQRVRSSRFTSLLGVIESAAEPPRVQFDFVTSTRGLDYVAQVRSDVPN